VKTFSPKAKIVLYILLATAVFFSNSLKVSLLSLGFVTVFAVKIPFSTLKRGLIPVMLFLLFTFVSNVLYQTGDVIYKISGISITDKGLLRGGLLTLKLFILILGAKVLTATTRAEDLVAGMGELLGPIGKIVFVRDLIFTMSLTLRLLPIVYNEALELYRDVKNSEGTSVADKVRMSVSLLTPLFERSLKKAKEMSDMEKDFEY
jgi:energy-coupling factor transport system permease protein